jgi:hypothetical protein
MKPDVLKQMLKIEETRRKVAEEKVKNASQQVTIQRDGQPPQHLNPEQVVELIRQVQGQLAHMKETCDKLIKERIELNQTIKTQNEKINEVNKLNTILSDKLKIYGSDPSNNNKINNSDTIDIVETFTMDLSTVDLSTVDLSTVDLSNNKT